MAEMQAWLTALVPDLSPEARQVLTTLSDGGKKATATVKAVRAAGLLREAVLVQAAALPARVALYWGWCCVEHYLSDLLEPAGKAALAAAQEWLAVDENNPVALEATAKAGWLAAEAELAAGDPSAAGWLCRGAYWCGDNVVPPEVEVVQKVPPLPLLPAKMAALAISLCILKDPMQQTMILGGCLDLAGKIAQTKYVTA